MDEEFRLNPNKLVQFLRKRPSEFTKEDIIRFIKENNIKMLDFNYVGRDDRLKTLNFVIGNEKHLRQLLDFGERVDGSSLFPYIGVGNSDLYVVPRFKTAFINPLSSIPTLNLLCSYFDGNGKELDMAPEYIVKKAQHELKKKTGIILYAFGELEYYVIFRSQDELFPGTFQNNYHESRPFIKYEDMRKEILYVLASIGVKTKYGHAEVGNIITSENNTRFEQNEIELALEPLEEMADHIIIAKWIMRNIAVKYGVEITFAPKIAAGHAGTGLHIHIAAMKDSRNVMLNDAGELSETTKRIIGGLLKLAPSLTAFGNTIPTSYLRLVPHQEAPTNLCWGDKNRSVLIRVPLGWRKISCLSSLINKTESGHYSCEGRQTVEMRCPDGSANIYLLLAGIAVAAKNGLTNDESLELTKKFYVNVDIFKDENKELQEKLEHLPSSCFESAEKLKEHAPIYQEDGVFSKSILEGLEKKLKSFNDKDLNNELKKDKQKAEEYVKNFIHCG
ncbi:MAG: glutamine synthetase family protein [Candidatus Bathyarchaeota archaeon]|nr:glutamine synthetase family protein [Candidatus Bathyarchaeota archaeon]